MLLQLIILADGLTGGTIWDVVHPLLNYGAVGVVLAWFLFKADPRMRKMEEAIDRQTRALVLLAIALPFTTDAVKAEAEKLRVEIDVARKRESKE